MLRASRERDYWGPVQRGQRYGVNMFCSVGHDLTSWGLTRVHGALCVCVLWLHVAGSRAKSDKQVLQASREQVAWAPACTRKFQC